MWHPGRQVRSLRFGSRLPVPGSRRSGERGAALVTVLLFMMLVFILITSMLSVTGNEIAIAGLQRDSVRAMDLAQAGIQEAIRRAEEGRPFQAGFNSSLAPGVQVSVVSSYVGVGASYLELRADATVGRSTRRLSALVLQQQTTFPPDITFAASVSQQGSAAITCGDAYSGTFIEYKSYPTNACAPPESITYAGWRVSKVAPGAVSPCYNNAQCIADNSSNPDLDKIRKWYPGTRRSVNADTDIGAETNIGAQIRAFQLNAEANQPSCLPTNPVYDEVFSGTIGTFVEGTLAEANVTNWRRYGFDRDDPDGGGALPSQIADIFPCGLPYKWVPETFTGEDGITVYTRWFKFVFFEQWLQNYWRFDEAKVKFVKRNGGPCVDGVCLAPPASVQPDLITHQQFGAVPPFPTMAQVNNNYDCKISGGGVLDSLPRSCTLPDGSASTTDLGCKNPPMSCSPTNPKNILLEGDWTINGTIAGHGTIVVDGTLIVNGTFDYWGTIMVDGTLQAGTGNVNIHGGLVALDTLQLIGNITVEGGGTVGGVPPTGPSNVIGKAWWER